MKKVIFAALLAAGFISAPVFAQQSKASWYAGGSFGQSKANDACDGASELGFSCDDSDTAWKIIGGYQVNRNFALELGYTDLGEVSASGGGLNASIESSAWELVGLGILPLANRFSLFGKAGLFRSESDLNISGIANESETNTGLTFGVGAMFDVTSNVSVRAEWQRYQDVGGGDTGEADVDVMSVGALFRF
jgi:OOP family OmpA-OmpF porin